MAKEFKLPELGENIESADVINVMVKVGDQVEKEQGIIEIETDKATVEVPTSVEGTIKEVLVKRGDNVKVGQTILTFENGSDQKPKEKKKDENKKENKADKETVKNDKPKEEKKSPGKKDVVEVKLPELGENIDSADVINVLIKKGDQVEKDQGILEIETDKATIEVPSPIAGNVVEVLIKAGNKAKVGQSLIKVETTADVVGSVEVIPEDAEIEEKTAEDKEKGTQQKDEEKKELRGERENIEVGEKADNQPPISKGSAPAAPSVRRIAREIGVDINHVPGSGPGGRISMDDVKGYAKKLNEGKVSGGGFTVGIKAETLPDFTKFGQVERKEMSKVRSKTAEHLSYAWAVTPHVTQFDKADINELEKVRKELNPKAEKAGGKLTITAILIKVITSALKVFPQFNSSVDMEKREIIYKKYFNIGIAVDTEHGLIVPVIKNTERKNLIEISKEMGELAKKARHRKISLEELQGGSITITNLGGIGGTYFTPIVNSPEVAILGVSRGSYEPVYNNGEFVPRLMLPLSLSYDHRIIDGADAARFLRWVCEVLEQPMKLLLEG